MLYKSCTKCVRYLKQCITNKNKYDLLYVVTQVEPFKDKTMDYTQGLMRKKYHILSVCLASTIYVWSVLSYHNFRLLLFIFVMCCGYLQHYAHVQFLNKSQKIGALSPLTSFSCDIEYDEDFTMSHTTSNTTNVFVSRYTVLDMYPFI